KVCDQACTPYGAPISFHGTVCNTGDTNLSNIAVTDDPRATIVFAAKTSKGNDFNPAIGLAAGECVDYTGSYSPSGNLCGPFSDTITVTAVDPTGLTVSNTDPCIDPVTQQSSGPRPPVTATCTVCNNPCINATKTCQTTVAFA